MKIGVPSKSDGQGEWELCPAGTYPAVLVDVIDLGEVEQPVYGKPGEMKKEHQAKFAFQIAERMSTGKPYLFTTWGMKVSLHEKAKMRKLLEALNGKAFNEGEEIDADAFIGCNCLLNVIHKKSADGMKVYANIGGILAAMKGVPPLMSEGYVRVQDRPKDAQAPDVDSDIPF